MPNGEDSGVTLKVVSLDGSAPRAVARAYAQSIVGTDTPDIAAMEKQNAEIVSACIVGWSGLQDDDGQPLPYSADKCLELLGNSELAFIREQVETFVSKRVNFFRTSEAVAS